MSEQKTTDMSQHFYRASAADFMKIPGSPVAYWASDEIRQSFNNADLLGEIAPVRQGLATANNDRFIRLWYEVSLFKSGFCMESRKEAQESNKKWFPYNKGGEFRKWYGNNDYLVNWQDDGAELNSFKPKAVIRNPNFYFRPSITWTLISSSYFGVRVCEHGFVFDVNGMSIFPDTENIKNQIISLLCSKVAHEILKIINESMAFQVSDIAKIPVKGVNNFDTNKAIKITKNDWDSYETSWDFSSSPLLAQDIIEPTLSVSYTNTRTQGLAYTQEMQHLEEKNNSIFIDAYGLQDELTSNVLLNEITLTCNPHYRYSGDLTEQQREERLQSDTIAELISYAIGCMMGRYSLDREGLVYAHAGNQGFAELVSEGAYTTFAADDDAILPITEQEWFSDDVTNRVSEFIRTVWGEQHLEENLQFIADSLCLYAIKPKKGERALETIRRYLGTQFYKDHLKTYKRRPIYWLFSSGKHKAFECLVYLHRYHEGTLARMRTEYVIPLTARINARINRLNEEVEAASSTSERKQLMAELKTLQNQQAELATFDEQHRHHADMRISLDLDDGVKENYGKFGNLLDSVRVVTGKAPK